MSVRPLVFFIRIGTSPVLQHHFTGVRTVSPTAGLDRVENIYNSIGTNSPMRILGNEHVTLHMIDLQNNMNALLRKIFRQKFILKSNLIRI